MRILSHYFVARYYGFFSSVLVAALVMLATIELVLNLEELSGLPDAARAPGLLGLLQTLSSFLWSRVATTYLVDLLPVASFLAAFLTFALAGRRLEWVALQAAGVRPFRVVLPVLAAAGLLAFGAAVVDETIVLRAKRASLAHDRFDREEIDLERRAFWYHRGPVITNVGRADPATKTLHDVELYERGVGEASGRLRRIVRARRVRILDDGRWRFVKADVWTFDPADPLAGPRYRTNQDLELDLDALPRDTLALADPANAPLRTLERHLSRPVDESDAAETADHRRLTLAYHERLSRPWRVVALCGLGLPFGLAVDPRGRFARAAAAALLALAAYFALANAGTTATRLALLPIGLSSWAIPALCAVLAMLGLARQRA